MKYKPRKTWDRNTTLTKDQVIAIYKAVWSGEQSGIELSEKYKVSRQTISNIKRGHTWSEVTQGLFRA